MPFGSRSVLRVNALLKGEIDATTSNEDNIFDLERRGEIDKVRVLADNDSLKLYIGAGVDFAVTRKLLAGSRDAVKRFTQALSEAIALGAARPWGGEWYLHPLFESERSRGCWNSCTGLMCSTRSRKSLIRKSITSR